MYSYGAEVVCPEIVSVNIQTYIRYSQTMQKKKKKKKVYFGK